MTTITISVNEDVEQEFREHAKEKYNGKKGYLGDAITEAMQKWLEDHKSREVAARAEALLNKGFHFGKLLYKDRAELHER